jgi:two-component system LytT family response regulator
VCFELAKEEMKVPYISIKQLLEKLPQDRFIQVHRMWVVNQDYIDYVDMVNGVIRLKNGGQVEIGVTYKGDVRRRLNG